MAFRIYIPMYGISVYRFLVFSFLRVVLEASILQSINENSSLCSNGITQFLNSEAPFQSLISVPDFSFLEKRILEAPVSVSVSQFFQPWIYFSNLVFLCMSRFKLLIIHKHTCLSSQFSFRKIINAFVSILYQRFSPKYSKPFLFIGTRARLGKQGL